MREEHLNARDIIKAISDHLRDIMLENAKDIISTYEKTENNLPIAIKIILEKPPKDGKIDIDMKISFKKEKSLSFTFYVDELGPLFTENND